MAKQAGNGQVAAKPKQHDHKSAAESQFDFLTAMEGSTMSIVIFNKSGEIQFFNQAAENIWGYSREEVIGENINMLTPAGVEFYSQSKSARPVIKGTKNQGREIVALTKDGTELDISISVSQNGQNGETLFTALVQDITEQKKKETEQEQLQRELETRMNQVNIACIVSESDLKGNILYVNDKLCEVSQYTREECIGQPHSMFRHPDMPKEVFKEMWSTIGKGEIFRGKIKNRKKDGDHYWVDAIIAPVLGENGKPVKYIGVRYDITDVENKTAELQKNAEEMRAAEEELRQNMEELNATQEQMERKQREMSATLEAINFSSAYIEFDTEGHVLNANDKFLSATKYDLSEIEGKHHRIFVGNEHAKSSEYAAFWTALRSGQNQTGEFKRFDKNGKAVYLFASYVPVRNEAGEVMKIIKIANDVTQERNLRISNYQTLEQAVDSIITINANKEVTFMNEAAVKMFGFTKEEVLGKNVKMLVPMEHQGRHDQYVDANIKTNVNKVVGVGRDLEMTRKDGSSFWGNLSLSKVEIDGELQYTAFIKDITAAKHNEFAFEEVIKGIKQLETGSFDFNLNIDGLKVDESVKQVIVDLANLRDNLKQIVSELNEVVTEAGEKGNLNARLNLKDTQGSWKQLTDSVNMLLQSIAEPVLEFNSIITEMSKGDLSKTFEMKTEGDLKNMAASLNTAIANLNELLGTINDNANTVAGAAKNSVEKVESMKSNTDEMASAISQMAKGAQDQAQKTDESSKLAEQVLSSSSDMESKSEIINKAAESGVKSCEEGLKIIKRLVENMDGINDSAGLTSGSIKVLTERAEEIGRTLNVITDIAAQTNLLALNAAIEAARAGDAGRGFAVVAEEIRKLAEDSRKSAIDIEKIIGDVQKDTQSASKAIDTMTVSVKEGAKATTDAEKIFEEISESSEETLKLSKSIKEASGSQRSSIETVVKNIEQIVVVAEETAAGTEEIATSSASLNTGMEDVAASSNQLTRIAQALQEGVAKFKLK